MYKLRKIQKFALSKFDYSSDIPGKFTPGAFKRFEKEEKRMIRSGSTTAVEEIPGGIVEDAEK